MGFFLPNIRLRKAK